jgi:ketosteroid isomerase-like protein
MCWVSSANVDVIRRLNAAFNANDLATFQSLLDPDVEFFDHIPLPDVQASARGVEDVTSVLEHWRDGFTSFHADVVEYVDLGDYVVCSTRWKFKSRDDAIELDWIGAEAHQVRDGKLVWSAAGFRDSTAAIQATEERSGTGAAPPRE